MRVLVLLALLFPTIAVAKYEGSRIEHEPITIAIVFASQHPWVSDREDDEVIPPEVHEALRIALDAVHAEGAGRVYVRPAFDEATPIVASGSEAILIGYDAGARVITRTQLDHLRGDSLGDATQYRDRVGTDLVIGLEIALAELAKSPTKRRALIVIGDGADTYLDTAPAQLASFQARAYAFRTRVYGLRYRTVMSPERNVFPLLTQDWESADPLATKLPALISRIAREQPPIDRAATTRPASPRPIPWFWLGVGAFVVAIAAGVLLARPRAAT
jgi:hypothetical protein